MRRQFEYDQTGNFRTSTQFNQTPRNMNRPNIPIDSSRRSTTPTKIQERISNSPLKTPLQNAVNKVVKTRQNQFERTSINMNKGLGRSNLKDESPIISMAKKIYYDEDIEAQQLRAHPQTASFIRKYFETAALQVPLQRFIQKIMQEYETLWGTQNAEKIFEDFTYKVADIFGNDYIDLRELIRITKDDGMIGLILRIFKQIKNDENTRSSNYISFTQNPQVVNISRSFQQRLTQNQSITGLKNVVQQFMESMYQAMQNQIYQKFNIQMRRMVVKYRQAQKLLKKVNQKINAYADIFDFDSKIRQKEKKYQSMIQQLTNKNDKIQLELSKQRELFNIQKKEKDKLNDEVQKLKETLQKYQNAVLTKAIQNNGPSQLSMFRQNSSQSRLTQKPVEMMKNSCINQPQPFKITIDTQVYHKQNVPPQTKTVTTFYPNPPLPVPVNGIHRQSYQNRTVHFKPSTSPFTTSRVTTYRPLSPTPLSPYQNRVNRPI